MSAIDTISRIVETQLVNEELKYCLVNERKIPFTITNVIARINRVEDFVDLHTLFDNDILNEYSGVGISVQASKVIAIDIDNCVTKPFSINHINDFAKDIINIFKEVGYVEFSFSGTGIRILLKAPAIKNYSKTYRTKHSKLGLEFYQYNMPGRYVTVTGKVLYNNTLKELQDTRLITQFLDTYLKKEFNQTIEFSESSDSRTEEDLMKLIRRHYIKNSNFQELWFTPAPGSGKDESERDFFLVKYIFNNITQDRNKVKLLVEKSHFFKTKDNKHIFKWRRNNHWYFNYIFNNILGGS